MELTANSATRQGHGALPHTLRVTPDNFERAESDMYFADCVKRGGFGRLTHHRDLISIEKQTVVRSNRDTLYSSGVFDLEAGPVTLTLPNAHGRFMSMMVLDEDQYAVEVVYGAGRYSYDLRDIGTRYALIAIRSLVDPTRPGDLEEVRSLQDAIIVEQKRGGRFVIPNWDGVSQKKVRDALLALGETIADSKRTFGQRGQVDPIKHLIGTAIGWGGNPEKDAYYLTVTPALNDGTAIHRLTVREVPVDAFWSISVYNATGYFEPNKHGVYSVNSITAQKDADGAVTVQFGGFDGKSANCLPTPKDWNYTVRLYRPRPEILSGKWKFPEAVPLK
jgi:hypothetical protein